MIRGSQTLTAHFPPAFEADSSRKGKKNVHTEVRDICMTYRFYYYYHIVKKRFDNAVADMEKEFFISATTIIARVTENNDLLKKIIAEAPERKHLRRMYPQFNWN